MVTLTVNTNAFDDVNEAAQALVHSWRMVVQRARREGIAARIPYLAVFEETKQGWPHLHILCRAPYINQAWLSERMAEYAESPIVDIRAVSSSRMASRYVAKYVSKGPGRYDGTKRYWKTQDYLRRPTGWERDRPINDSDTWFHPVRPESLAGTLDRAGWRVTWSSFDDFSAVNITPYASDPLWHAWLARGGTSPYDP